MVFSSIEPWTGFRCQQYIHVLGSVLHHCPSVTQRTHQYLPVCWLSNPHHIRRVLDPERFDTRCTRISSPFR